LVKALALSPPSLGVVRFAGDQHLADEVLREFDPAFRLSELSSSWASLMAGATSFGDKLQVSNLCPLFSLSFWFDVCFFCLLLLIFPFLHLRPTLGTT
jgi:hypothetical protein